MSVTIDELRAMVRRMEEVEAYIEHLERNLRVRDAEVGRLQKENGKLQALLAAARDPIDVAIDRMHKAGHLN